MKIEGQAIVKKTPGALTLALLALLPQGAAAQSFVFPCKVERVCVSAPDEISCGETGGWKGDYTATWSEGELISLATPRGTFAGVLLTEPQVWPVVFMVQDRPEEAGLAQIDESGAFSLAMPLGRGEVLALHGSCGPVEVRG